MHKKDIIVVGASAGGVAALKTFVAGLPENFGGSVFIVLHLPAYAKSRLPEILAGSTRLPCTNPSDGEKIKDGHIYIAPSDHHLLVEQGRVVVKKGPKENRFRPSIDALFRSAAYIYGPRVIGIVLTGLLNDGTSGLWSVKRMGGVAIVQQPDDAEHADMPENVLEHVQVDHSVPVSEMGPLIQSLVSEPAIEKFKYPEEDLKLLKTEVLIATRDNAFEMGIMDMGELTPFTCPECHGALVRLVEGNLLRYRCHTGHAYTASSLLASVNESVEEMLWQSMRGLEECTMLLHSIADHFKKLENAEAVAIFQRKAKEAGKRAQVIHDSIFTIEQFSEDLRFEDKH